MSPCLVGILASIFAEQARFEAMKAENARRLHLGQTPVYGQTEFGYAAAELDVCQPQRRTQDEQAR